MEEQEKIQADEVNTDTRETTDTAQTDAEAGTEATAEGEAAVEGEAKVEDEAEAEEDSKADKAKKVKIGIIVAGGVFILLAAVYAAAVLGGRTNQIPVAMEEITEEVIEVTEPVKEQRPIVTVQPQEEETPDTSLISVLQGNRRYDECMYADGGVVIVRTGDKYGAIDYEGKEIAPVKYATVEQWPTAKGYFVLSNTISDNVTEEKDGATLSYSKDVTTYTLYNNAGQKIYEGNNVIAASGDVYAIGIEDQDDIRKNRIEYYRFDGKNKAFKIIYVKDAFSMTGYRDGKTVVYGFSDVPTEDQDTNPTNLVGGIMDEQGNVKWFVQAPGITQFNDEVAQWKEENKIIKTTTTKKKKAKAQKKEIKYDEDGYPIEEDDTDEYDDEYDDEIEYDEDGYPIEDDDEEYEEDTEEEELTEEELEEIELTEEELEVIEDEADLSSGPQFHMDTILNAPVGGYFVSNDVYDVTDPYTFYDEKGTWVADIDTSYMKADNKKGFVVGNFNNGEVEVSKYISDGEIFWNYGSNMVLEIGEKDVLIDAAKVAGMTADSLNDRMVVAVYDDINITDSQYWMFRDGDRCGYIDHKGKEMKLTYDDATDFVNGHALVVKNGTAILIDEEFAELEEIGPASGVIISGDVMMVLKDGTVKNYIMKEDRENPLGKKDKDASDKEDPKAAVTPTPDASKKKKSK